MAANPYAWDHLTSLFPNSDCTTWGLNGGNIFRKNVDFVYLWLHRICLHTANWTPWLWWRCGKNWKKRQDMPAIRWGRHEIWCIHERNFMKRFGMSLYPQSQRNTVFQMWPFTRFANRCSSVEVADCDLNSSFSSLVSWKQKATLATSADCSIGLHGICRNPGICLFHEGNEP